MKKEEAISSIFEELNKAVDFLIKYKRPLEQFSFLSDEEYILKNNRLNELRNSEYNIEYALKDRFGKECVAESSLLIYRGYSFYFIKTSTL